MIVFSDTDNYPHTQPELPPTDVLPTLVFEAVVKPDSPTYVHIQARPLMRGSLALLRSPEGVRYVASDAEMADMLKQHTGEYELHNIQHARQAIQNYKTDKKIEALADNMKDLGGAVMVVGSIGVAFVMAGATFTNYFGNKFATDPFNDTVAAQAAGTVFQINKDKGSASIGKPEAGGITWYFSDKPEACTSRLKTKKETEGKFIGMSVMDRSYTRDCNYLEKWPADSVQQQFYTPAYTAYLQATQPAAGHTAESVQKIISARRAYEALKPQ